ncbi:hypothetical protein Ahy_B06g080560 [Arachis hypogaea]|uniref:Aminotransferase-like plant mobile domain-containing protein n=1 Tax=Arachis hypogaea TaxID=3818 RepID=A0A444YIH3_ARAHY|nr:hypothetical protein Ahy_B06g080560 [Arachis hypogaea]
MEDVAYILGLPINGEAVTGRSDSSHQFLVENCIACFGQEPGPQDHVLGKLNIAWVRRCRDSELCDTQESVERYIRAHIFCVLGTIVFTDKSTTSLNSKFLPLLRDFHLISSYSWGAASRVIGTDIQDIYGGLLRILGEDSTTWDLTSDDFIWRPYMGVGVPDVLDTHLLPPGLAFDLGRDHCKRLTGAQNHDWGQIYSQWVNRWSSDRYNALQIGEEIVDFHPLPVYYEWYTQQYGVHLRLSDRVPEPQPTQAPYIPKPQLSQAPEPYIPPLVIPAAGHFSPLGGSNTISFSQVLRDLDYLFPTVPQEGPATSQQSAGRRATSGHASDFDFDQSMGHEEGDLGYDLQHWYDLGGASGSGISGSSLYDTGGASMTDFGASSGLDVGVSQGHSYNLRTQTAPPDKYTPSLYSKKAPRK